MPVIEGVPHFHKEMVVDVFGPVPPTLEQVRSEQFVEHIRRMEIHEKAAGFSEDIACLRALQDAMSGLYFVAG
jgi:CDK-activating kinase assembly factor MAT1